MDDVLNKVDLGNPGLLDKTKEEVTLEEVHAFLLERFDYLIENGAGTVIASVTLSLALDRFRNGQSLRDSFKSAYTQVKDRPKQ